MGHMMALASAVGMHDPELVPLLAAVVLIVPPELLGVPELVVAPPCPLLVLLVPELVVPPPVPPVALLPHASGTPAATSKAPKPNNRPLFIVTMGVPPASDGPSTRADLPRLDGNVRQVSTDCHQIRRRSSTEQRVERRACAARAAPATV
jgi:hypothetical protein